MNSPLCSIPFSEEMKERIARDKEAVKSSSGHHLSAEDMQAQILRNHIGSMNAASKDSGKQLEESIDEETA